jgi:hypothetical protein
MNQTRLALINYLNENIIRPNDWVLDIGCGTKEISNKLKCLHVTTLDIWKPFEPDIWCDLTKIPRLPCEDDGYHVVLLLDVIEHLPKDKGFKVLKEAKRVSKRSIVILTPLWWDANTKHINNPDSPYYKNEYDKHLSLWEQCDLVGFQPITTVKALNKYFFGEWTKHGTD